MVVSVTVVAGRYECKCKLYCDAEQLPDQMFMEADDMDLMYALMRLP